MARLEGRKPAPPNTYQALLDESRAAGTDRTGLRSAIVLQIMGSGLFVFTRAALTPNLPAWLGSTSGRNPDNVAMMFVLVTIIEWAVLAVITVVPVIAALVALDRLWISRALTDASHTTGRRIYRALALLTAAGSVPIWFLAWDHAVVPTMESVVGQVVLVGIVLVVGLYSLKNMKTAS